MRESNSLAARGRKPLAAMRRRRERDAELLVSVEAKVGGVGSLADAKEFFRKNPTRMVEAPGTAL
jgi:hypothetical protein